MCKSHNHDAINCNFHSSILFSHIFHARPFCDQKPFIIPTSVRSLLSAHCHFLHLMREWISRCITKYQSGWPLSSHDQIPWLLFCPTFQEYLRSIDPCNRYKTKRMLYLTAILINYWRLCSNAKLYLVKNSFLAKLLSRTILVVTDHMQGHIFAYFPWLFFFLGLSVAALIFPDFSRWLATLTAKPLQW